ncbi:MAG: DUF3891 family protein [Acidobacteriota bacterium]
MIVADLGDRLRFTTQNDHAHLAAELLSLWRDDDMPTHPRRDELLFAAREHDNGWREEDAAPSMHPDTGVAYNFITLPTPRRQALWQRGLERYADEQPYATLLIVEHARNLHRRRRDDPDWRDILTRWDNLGEELRTRLAEAMEGPLDETIIAADYRLVDVTDTLSLAIAAGWSKPFTYREFESVYEPATETLRITPFPFAGETTLHLSCREVENRNWESDRDLATSLALATWRRQPVRIAPLEPA